MGCLLLDLHDGVQLPVLVGLDGGIEEVVEPEAIDREAVEIAALGQFQPDFEGAVG